MKKPNYNKSCLKHYDLSKYKKLKLESKHRWKIKLTLAIKLGSFQSRPKEMREGAGFATNLRLFHSFAPRKAKDFAHMMFSSGY